MIRGAARTAIAVVALATAPAFGCRGTAAPPAPHAPTGPPLTLAWPALDGGTIDLATLRGQIVVLHAFATWSPAAGLEVEALDAADARPDVTVVGLALDPEGYQLVSPWRKGAGARYLIALADDATRSGASALGRIHQVPTTFVLDAAGRVHQRFEHQLSPADLDAAIAAAAHLKT